MRPHHRRKLGNCRRCGGTKTVTLYKDKFIEVTEDCFKCDSNGNSDWISDFLVENKLI